MKINSLFFFALIMLSGLITYAQPTFTTSFSPSTIGPGSSSVLTYTITNSSGSPAADLAFTNTLPAGVTLTNPSNIIFTKPDGAVTAPDGGTTISFSGGKLANGASLTIKVNVTSTTLATHTNVTGDLTSSLGNSGTATGDLTVSNSLTAFSKIFTEDTVKVNEKTTLTYTIDNSNVTFSGFLTNRFTENLPLGLKVSNPAVYTSNCPNLTFEPQPGNSSFTFLSKFVTSYSCTASVELVADNPGRYISSNSVTTQINSGTLNDSGIAIAVLQVETNNLNNIVFQKEFLKPTVAPGDLATLKFTITNLDRGQPLTAINFSDDLNSFLTGALAQSLPSNVCGGVLSGTSTLSFTGGSVGPEGSCDFSVQVLIPAAAAGGTYTNETTAITGTKSGSSVTGPTAKSDLTIQYKPTLTKTIIPNPVAPGSSTIFRYTLTNTDPVNAMTLGKFEDDAHGLAATANFTFPSGGFCGSGTMAYSVDFNGSRTSITLSDASLAAGASCTFDVGVDLPNTVVGGEYTSQIINLSGELNGVNTIGKLVSNEVLNVTAAPQLTKSFLGAALPGDTLTVEYVLSLDTSATQSFTGIMFTDKFRTLTSGSVTISLETTEINSTLCSGAVITGLSTDSISFSNGSLSPGDTCKFYIKVKVPDSAGMGQFNSTTSVLTDDGSFTGVAASANLDVIGLVIKKENSSPVFPGDQMAITYSFINPHPSFALSFYNSSGTYFQDKLDAELSGLTYTGGPVSSFCGTNSALTRTTSLRFSQIEIAPSDTCKLVVNVDIPVAASYDIFNTELSRPTFLLQDGVFVQTNQGNVLLMNQSFEVSPGLEFSKRFLTNAEPKDTVSLEFKIKNLNPTKTLTNIAFTDNVSAMHPGFTTVGLPQSNVVGAGSSLSTVAGGDSIINLSGGSLAAGAEITFVVKVKVPADIYSGTFVNTTSLISYDLNGNTLSSNAATADLIVNNNRRPTFSKAFANDTILTGQTSTLTFTIDNSLNGDAVTNINFSDNLPQGMLIAASPNITNSCAVGTVIGLVGSASFSVSNASILANSTCTYSVDVKINKSKLIVNQSENLTSAVGNSGPSKDSIYVKIPEPISFSASTLSHNAIGLTASPNANNMDSILVAFSSDGVFGEPMGLLTSGNAIGGGGEVLYKGLASGLPNHMGLTQSTKYYYKAWSYGYDLYSKNGLLASDTTLVDPAQVFGTQASQMVNCVTSTLKLTVDTILNIGDYQWQVKLGGVGSFNNLSVTSKYPKIDSSTLTIGMLSLTDDKNEYRCIIATKGDKDTTSLYTLNVFGNPIVTLNPKDSSNCAGSDFEFYVAATGPGLTYQWQKRVGSNPFLDIGGATNDTLALSAVPVSDDSTFYRCVITGTCGVSISDSAILRAPLQPTLLAGTVVNPTTCLGMDGYIQFTSTNLPNGTYSLSFTSTGTASPQSVTVSANAFTMPNLSSGSYSDFSVTHLGCTGNDASSKVLSDPPTPTILAGAATNPTTCSGTNGSIPFRTTNLPDGIYSLSFTSTGTSSPQNVTVSLNDFTLSNLSSGTYGGFSVTYLGCTGTDASFKTVSDPILSASASNSGPYQEGSLIQLAVSNGTTFDWTGPSGFVSSLQNPSIPKAKTTNTGIYTATVADNKNCSATLTTNVIVGCTSPAMSYYLVYGGNSPELIAPLQQNLEIQISNRPITVVAVTTCSAPVVESVELQLSGTSVIQYEVDNDMPFYLHEIDNAPNGAVLDENLYSFQGRGYDQNGALGNVVIGPDVIQFSVVLGLDNITSPTLSAAEVCVGSSIIVTSSTFTNGETSVFKVGNLFNAYLSDENGSFANSVLIGTSSNAGSINSTIPNYVKGGLNYKVMVISTAPVVSSPASAISLHVIPSDLGLVSPLHDIDNVVQTNKAINVINARNKIENTSRVDFEAGRRINLDPGFESKEGTVFKAAIKPTCPSVPD
ncbi:MAG: hypothetical protein ACI9IP_002690 [Arcticibacterium sp.]|jgi:hypothetical protein